MTTHELKTWPVPFAAVLAGTKTYEIRVADRDYKVGDVLHLREFVPREAVMTAAGWENTWERSFYTGRSLDVEVTYLTPGGEWGLPPGLCVMSIRKVGEGTLCGELLESLRLASTTSDGYRDAHAAYQRWAARLAPDAIGDEAKRAAIEAAHTAPDRPPLTEEQRLALRYTCERIASEVVQLRAHGLDYIAEDRECEVAALRAVLGDATREQEGATT